MRSTEKSWYCTAGINGFLAIAMGAVAAHAIADAQMAALAEKASLYQLVHAVVLLVLADRRSKAMRWARWIFLIAILLFCGTLYLKALTGWMAATRLAPLGGLSFMAGWLLIACASRDELSQ